MAAAHFVLTLTGSPQRLSSVITTGANVPTGHFLSLQADSANTAVVYVGGFPSLLSSSLWGQRIEIPVTNIPAAPSIIEHGGGALVNLQDFQVLGANNDKLHIMLAD